MRTTKVTLAFMLFAVIIFAMGQPALAGRELGQVLPLLEVDKTAPGTKVFCTLAVHYEIIPDDNSDCDMVKTDMAFLMRVRKGNQLYGFSGIERGICFSDYEEQAQVIGDFVTEYVIPVISSPGASWAIKSVGNLMEDDMSSSGLGDGPLFSIVDITIAVKE